ncbi:MAG TPA: hypothetical protein VMV77_21785 [Bacteroidales bacterium]|nr:hypothetical protein [Bacteroidales bacterium]
MAGAAAQMRQGRQMMNRAMDAMRDMSMPDLENVYKDIAISTAAQDLQREELARSAATATDIASKAGARGVVGSMQDILEFQTKGIQSIAAQLEEKRTRRDELIAADEARIREVRERRMEMDKMALSNLYATGYAEKMQGLGGLAGATAAFTSAAPSLFEGFGGGQKKTTGGQ